MDNHAPLLFTTPEVGTQTPSTQPPPPAPPPAWRLAGDSSAGLGGGLEQRHHHPGAGESTGRVRRKGHGLPPFFHMEPKAGGGAIQNVYIKLVCVHTFALIHTYIYRGTTRIVFLYVYYICAISMSVSHCGASFGWYLKKPKQFGHLVQMMFFDISHRRGFRSTAARQTERGNHSASLAEWFSEL